MKNITYLVSIVIFLCCIWVVVLFFIDDVMKKNYNVATPSSGIYDAFVKYDEDLIKYARDVYSDEGCKKSMMNKSRESIHLNGFT